MPATPKTGSRTKPAQTKAVEPQQLPVQDIMPPTQQPASARKPGGKLGRLVDLLERSEGVDLADMMQATGWQAHSVRGAMAGALKKRFALAITSQKTEAGRIYRIASQATR